LSKYFLASQEVAKSFRNKPVAAAKEMLEIALAKFKK
jgi:hypothetical protein